MFQYTPDNSRVFMAQDALLERMVGYFKTAFDETRPADERWDEIRGDMDRRGMAQRVIVTHIDGHFPIAYMMAPELIIQTWQGKDAAYLICPVDHHGACNYPMDTIEITDPDHIAYIWDHDENLGNVMMYKPGFLFEESEDSLHPVAVPADYSAPERGTERPEYEAEARMENGIFFAISDAMAQMLSALSVSIPRDAAINIKNTCPELASADLDGPRIVNRHGVDFLHYRLMPSADPFDFALPPAITRLDQMVANWILSPENNMPVRAKFSHPAPEQLKSHPAYTTWGDQQIIDIDPSRRALDYTMLCHLARRR